MGSSEDNFLSIDSTKHSKGFSDSPHKKSEDPGQSSDSSQTQFPEKNGADCKKKSKIFELPISCILDNMDSGLFITDESDRLVWINNAVFNSIFEAPEVKNMVLNKPVIFFASYLEEFIVSSDSFMQWIKELVVKRKPFHGGKVAIKGGAILNFSYSPVFYEGEFSGGIWQLKKDHANYLYEELSVSKENSYDIFYEVVNKFQIKCCEINRQGRIINASPAFFRFSGYDKKKLLNSNFLDLCRSGKQEMLDCLRDRGSKLLNQNIFSFELEFIPNKDTRWVHCDVFYGLDHYIGSSGAFMIFMTDITMQKNIQDELTAAKDIAERTKLEQQQFLASMSHDIRTPLNAIIGMVLLMADTALSKEQEEYVRVLKNASNILLDMLNSVLDFAKIESGKQEVNYHEFNLPELLSALIETFSFKLSGKSVDIHYKIDAKIDHYLIGDKVLLNQVLMNLLANAEKFTSKGEINLKARVDKILDSSIWIEFKVEDTGIGISKENMKKIFQDFMQADDEIQINYGGFGLGLFICKSLVELMGGKVILESKEGKGTIFTFSLPFGKTNKKLSHKEMFVPPVNNVSDEIKGEILVVEDNPLNLKYLSKLLERHQIEFDTAEDGLEALNMAQNKFYDLILMDMKLPKMNGLRIVENLRNNQNPNIATPIILVSAATSGDIMNTAKKAGVNELLLKPYTPIQLTNILKKYLVEDDECKNNLTYDSNSFVFNSKLDTGYLQALYSGNCNYAKSLFEVFIECADEDWAGIEVLIQEKNWDELKDLVHKIKPNFSMVGLTWITAMMQETYDRLKEGDPDAAVMLIGRVKDEFDKYLPLIKEECKRMHQYLLHRGFLE